MKRNGGSGVTGDWRVPTRWWRDAGLELRQGLRALRRQPAFTAAAVAMLALGIGATTAMFSVVNAVLIQPLPYPDADELVRLRPLRPGAEQHRFTFSEGEFLTYEERSTALQGLAAFEPGTSAAFTSTGEPIQVTGARVTANLFQVLGVEPAEGRGFAAEEDRPGAAPVLVLGHALWQQMFGGEPGVVGRTIDVDARATTIVGVMPPGFRFPDESVAFWTPLALDRVDVRYQSGQILELVGRRRPGASPALVQDDLDRVSAQITDEALTRYPGTIARAVGLREDLAGEVSRPLLLLMATVSMVLVLVCLNLAGYLVAQGVARRRELAMRRALGASAGRIVRQLLAEGSLLAALGGLAGAALAAFAVDAVDVAGPAFLDAVGPVEVDLAVLAFAVLATGGSVLLFGLAPAWAVARGRAAGVLQAGRGAPGGPAARRFLSGLVLAQIAACVVLLTGAGLMAQTLAREAAVDPGFVVEGVLTFRVSLPDERYPDAADVTSFYDRAVDEVRSLPFVQEAAAITRVPMGGSRSIGFAWQEGKPVEPDAFPQELNMRWATPTYFEAMGIELLRGRTFQAGDGPGDPLVAVVSESLAEALWPGEDPMGRRFKLGRQVDATTPWRTVIGVVEDVRHESPRDGAAPTSYFSHRQLAFTSMSVVARLAGNAGDGGGPTGRGTARGGDGRAAARRGDGGGAAQGGDGGAMTRGGGAAAADVVDAVRRAVAAVDPAQPIHDVRWLRELVAGSMSMTRTSALTLVGFSLLALGFAAVGLYALVSYSIRQRFHEIALRRALGATGTDILALVMRRAGRLTAAGVAAGLAGALALARLLEGLVFGVATTDPLTLVVTCAVVGGVALAASLVPARRATGIGAGESLR